jgi:two-component system, OmpR family, heavy metal sensor histidine kinase CusS
MALFTASAIVLLCAAGAFLYWELKQILRAEDESTLADKIAVMRDILRERPDDLNALEEEVQWESIARTHAVYYGAFCAANRY